MPLKKKQLFRLMFAFAIVPSILQFIGYWYLPETPRFAFERDGVDTCEKVSVLLIFTNFLDF
jgi:hypothetical protein